MSEVVRYQEILRRLAIIDDDFVEDPAGLGLGLAGARVLDPKTVALVRVGALAAIGSPAVCLEWSTTRAPAADATGDEITDVLLAIALWPGSAGSSPPLARRAPGLRLWGRWLRQSRPGRPLPRIRRLRGRRGAGQDLRNRRRDSQVIVKGV